MTNDAKWKEFVKWWETLKNMPLGKNDVYIEYGTPPIKNKKLKKLQKGNN